MQHKTTGRPTRQICPGLLDALVKGLVLALRGTRPYTTPTEVLVAIKHDVQVLSAYLSTAHTDQDAAYIQLALARIAVTTLRGFCDIYPEGFLPPDAGDAPHKSDTAGGSQIELPS